MKQVWSVSVLVAFLILEGRVEYGNYLAVSAGQADMAAGWHFFWLALDTSLALVAGTIVAFAVDALGESVDELSRRLAPKPIDLGK